MFALKLYATIKDEEDEAETQAIIMKYILDECCGGILLLNDFNAILDHHSVEDIEIIQKTKLSLIAKCEGLEKCASISRHFRDRELDEQKENNQNIVCLVWIDVLDRIHFYFYHLFETGMRLNISETEQMREAQHKQEEKEEKEDERDEINESLLVLQKIIHQKMKNISFSFNSRFNGKKSNKFNSLSGGQAQTMQNIINMNDKIQKKTMMDIMFVKCGRKGLQKTMQHKISEFLVENNFDSDAVEDDVNGNDLTQSNINHYCAENKQERKQMELIRKFAKDTQCMMCSIILFMFLYFMFALLFSFIWFILGWFLLLLLEILSEKRRTERDE